MKNKADKVIRFLFWKNNFPGAFNIKLVEPNNGYSFFLVYAFELGNFSEHTYHGSVDKWLNSSFHFCVFP